MPPHPHPHTGAGQWVLSSENGRSPKFCLHSVEELSISTRSQTEDRSTHPGGTFPPSGEQTPTDTGALAGALGCNKESELLDQNLSGDFVTGSGDTRKKTHIFFSNVYRFCLVNNNSPITGAVLCSRRESRHVCSRKFWARAGVAVGAVWGPFPPLHSPHVPGRQG